jgi:L-threonylcarbamoyladenylate synthase
MTTIDSQHDPDAALDTATAALLGGAVVAIPTDTVYGLAVLAGDEAGLERLLDLKQRPPERNVAVLVTGKEQALSLASKIDPLMDRLMGRLWPGALTLVLEAGETTVGVRQPAHQWTLDLLVRTGPLATTSANLHGEPPLVTATEIAATFGPRLGLVVDGGRCGGAASTVVGTDGAALVVLREGAMSADYVAAAAGVENPSS